MNFNTQPKGQLPIGQQIEQQLAALRDSLDSAPSEVVTGLLDLYESKCGQTICDDTVSFEQPANDNDGPASDDFSIDVSPEDAQKDALRAILEDPRKFQELAKAVETLAISRPLPQAALNPGLAETITFQGLSPLIQPLISAQNPPVSAPVLHAAPERAPTIGTLEHDFTIKCDAQGNPIILGKGAMGIVVIGVPTIAGPEKAIKICTKPEYEARTRREFAVLSLLNLEGYPNAERLYRNVRGQLCYSMKRVDGESLHKGYQAFHQTAENPRLEDPEARAYFENTLQVKRVAGSAAYNPRELDQAFRALLGQLIAVASAVDVMHQKDVIHRDLKPDNVRVESLTKKPIVLDFGLAKIAHEQDLESDARELSPSELTQSGEIMGTIPYMSPEQASGNPNAHTYATDIYALGGMLYYLMTGTPAVTRADSKGNERSVEQLIALVRAGDIAPPVKLPFIKSKFQDLEAICQKAMHKDPSKRYASAKEMMFDLNAWLAGNSVEAYRESVGSFKRMQYDFHHWRRSNPRKTGAIGAMLLGFSGLGTIGSAYTYNQRSKANEAAAVAGESLDAITSSIEGQIEKILGSHSIESLPTEKLDEIINSGDLGRALQEARERLNMELRSSSSDSIIHRYSTYEAASHVLRRADRKDSELSMIEKTLKQRESDRLEMTKLLGSFRQEFASIRDFLGNDLETRISDTSQERIDSALGRFLPSFKSAPRRSSPSDDPIPFFPDCAQEIQNLVAWLESQELTADEVTTIKECVADLLSYKVLTLQRDGATNFAPHVTQYLETCNRYLEDARTLRGSLTTFDYVLWWRVSGALKDPRAEELQTRVTQFIDEALTDQSAASRMSTQDLASLAKTLLEQSRFEEALTLFKSMVSETTTRGSSSSISLPQQYLSELGSALALGSIASEALKLGDQEKCLRYAIQADATFNRALGTLAALPNDNYYKPMKESVVYLGLARTGLFLYRLSEKGAQEVHLTNIKRAHQEAKARSSSALVSRTVGLNLFNTGDFEGAIKEYTQALDAAPYLANEILPRRAQCYARLGLEDGMLNDVEQILAMCQAPNSTRAILPSQISLAASSVGSYLTESEANLSEEARQDYIEVMKELLSEVKNACLQGAPYSPERLSVDFEMFRPLERDDPKFFREYREFISSSKTSGARR